MRQQLRDHKPDMSGVAQVLKRGAHTVAAWATPCALWHCILLLKSVMLQESGRHPYERLSWSKWKEVMVTPGTPKASPACASALRGGRLSTNPSTSPYKDCDIACLSSALLCIPACRCTGASTGWLRPPRGTQRLRDLCGQLRLR